MDLSFDDLQRICTWQRSDWAELGQAWLAQGYDSPELQTLARLTTQDDLEAVVSLMPSVLRSLGVEVADEGFSEFEASGFGSRCRAAFALVQADLDRTGFGRFQMSPYIEVYSAWTMVYAQTSGGRRWTNYGPGVTANLDPAKVVSSVASHVCDTLLLCKQVRWPRCAEHPTKYLVSGRSDWQDTDFVPTDRDREWWCTAEAPHPVSEIGTLRLADVVPDTGLPTVPQ